MAYDDIDRRPRRLGAFVSYLAAMVLGVCHLAAAAVLTAFLGFVVPRYAAAYTSLRVKIPSSTQQVLDLSNWLQTNWQIVLGLTLIVDLPILILAGMLPELRLRGLWFATVLLAILGALGYAIVALELPLQPGWQRALRG